MNDSNYFTKDSDAWCSQFILCFLSLIIESKSFYTTSLTSVAGSTVLTRYYSRYFNPWSLFLPSYALTGITLFMLVVRSSRLVPITAIFSILRWGSSSFISNSKFLSRKWSNLKSFVHALLKRHLLNNGCGDWLYRSIYSMTRPPISESIDVYTTNSKYYEMFLKKVNKPFLIPSQNYRRQLTGAAAGVLTFIGNG